MRHARQAKRKRTARWPDAVGTPDAVAVVASYVGSAEHKGHPSAAGAPRLRSDASSCDPRYTNLQEPTQALRVAIRARQTGDFVGGFPKYVWGCLDGRLYEARLVNHELGQYKGYSIASDELPDDPIDVLRELLRTCRG